MSVEYINQYIKTLQASLHKQVQNKRSQTIEHIKALYDMYKCMLIIF